MCIVHPTNNEQSQKSLVLHQPMMKRRLSDSPQTSQLEEICALRMCDAFDLPHPSDYWQGGIRAGYKKC